MRHFFLLALLLCSASCGAQTAGVERLKAIQADPQALRAAIQSGEKAAFFCANCHGEHGVSARPEVPNLAGQNPVYLIEQIHKFAVGERKDPFMQGVIKGLKEEERLQVALFYAGQPVVPQTAEAALVAAGAPVFAKLCARCHGERARGNDATPRLAGQKREYLKAAITRYRDRTGQRNDTLMSIATATLKNAEVEALSHYLAQLQ